MADEQKPEETVGAAWLRRQEEEEAEPVMVSCPHCGAEQEDLDGFGVLFCPKCGWCTHASITDGRCGLCGEQRESWK